MNALNYWMNASFLRRIDYTNQTNVEIFRFCAYNNERVFSKEALYQIIN
jgi:hypothetical protein